MNLTQTMMQSQRLSRFILPLAIMMTMSAAAVQAAPTGSIEERIQRLERMADNPVLLQMNQRLADQQREIQRLQDAMDRLKRDQRQFLEQARLRDAETDQRISDLETQLKQFKGGAVPGSVPSSPMPQTQLTPQVAPAVGQEADSSPASMPTVSAVSSAAQPSPKRGIHAATAEENQAYQRAFAMMRAAKYSESISQFEAFLQKYPASSLASNASYWAGEGYLIKKAYDKALNAFEIVMKQYPGSAKEPDAMLRAADALQNLQKPKEAEALYQQLIERFPETRAAKSAQKRLQSS
ncbi:tol-pal system protein YbgF [Thiomicrorhabdus sp. zzn3]|uniref:tol-pal system protein YbgF n=1 Tax=Thiomicrorhabdus sp. zzn3 TaxID=3039775 RepID=UPI002436691D|nr:tol-pal system protein YbgF [Thiomicrorhabdus sp. zzn3]MDG6778200.1 tol-pal system protein YbgF [Thiomicrorhabdus sp. zzn3]